MMTKETAENPLVSQALTSSDAGGRKSTPQYSLEKSQDPSFRQAKMVCASGFLIIFSALLAGCITAPVYTASTPSEKPTCLTSTPSKELYVGLAVSGGGSRAALFAAGAYEALGNLRVGPEKQSLLEKVSFVSSVSGGSLASAYYVLNKPQKDIPVLTASGEMTEEYQQFFNEFKNVMARDYENPLLWRNIFSLRWFNPAWTAKSLQEILSEQYLGETTFEELAVRERNGDSPHFLVNTTLYNDGRRLVLSTLNREDLRYDFIKELDRHNRKGTLSPLHRSILAQRWEALQTRTPQDLRLDVCGVKVAGSVATSMSFPPIIGPVSFHHEDEDQYWHVGDGGLSDNTGAESLLMVFLKALQENQSHRALLIMFDSSFPFSVGGSALDHRKEAFSLFSYDFSRIPSIMEERSAAYRSMFFGVAQEQGMLPDTRKLTLIQLRHTDAHWKDDLSDLPESCHKEKKNWTKPTEVAQHLSGIVTRLWIESTCDRDLILTSAAKVVSQNEAKIQKFLTQ